MATSRLHELTALGQSVWVDNLSRQMLRDGELERLMREDAVTGITSNPTIFAKALSEGDAYDEQLAETLETESDPKEVFLALATRDVSDACDVLAPVWEETEGREGYVSIEVDPRLAADTQATIDEAMRLHEWIRKPNLFVKIPATPEGLPAIEEMIARGRSINVTLIFSLERYAAVAEAYVRGLERYLATGAGDLSKIASVASFFVSRVDTEADRLIDELGAPRDLRGRLAIANAKLAYQHYKEIVGSERWAKLASRGARPQRCLWASTSTKDPTLPRHPLHRGADRARHDQHDAARDDPGLPGPRARGREAGAWGRRGPARCSTASRRPASTTTRSSRRSKRRAWRSSSSPSTS